MRSDSKNVFTAGFKSLKSNETANLGPNPSHSTEKLNKNGARTLVHNGESFCGIDFSLNPEAKVSHISQRVKDNLPNDSIVKMTDEVIRASPNRERLKISYPNLGLPAYYYNAPN